MTLKEARRILTLNIMTLDIVDDQWRVRFGDWHRDTADCCAYVTDTLEDAVKHGVQMRYDLIRNTIRD